MLGKNYLHLLAVGHILKYLTLKLIANKIRIIEKKFLENTRIF